MHVLQAALKKLQRDKQYFTADRNHLQALQNSLELGKCKNMRT